MPAFVNFGDWWLNLARVEDVTLYSCGNADVSLAGRAEPVSLNAADAAILVSALEVLSIATPVVPIRFSSLPIALAAGQVS